MVLGTRLLGSNNDPTLGTSSPNGDGDDARGIRCCRDRTPSVSCLCTTYGLVHFVPWDTDLPPYLCRRNFICSLVVRISSRR